MNNFRYVGLSIAGTFLAFACGKETDNSSLSAADPAPSLVSTKLSGTGYNNKPCTLEVERNTDGSLKGLKFSQDFKVDYKIPAPGSGLYGVYYWPNTFDTSVNLADSSLSIERSLLRDADILEGDGQPLFWNVDKLHHKLVFKPSLTSPKKVTYHSVSRLAGVVPFVVIDGECNF